MKIIKALLPVIMGAAFAFMLLFAPSNSIAAQAKTFIIHFSEPSDWYFQTDENDTWMGLSVMDLYFVDGDKIVIDGTDYSPATLTGVTITVNKYVSELAVGNNASCIFYANGGVGTAYAYNNGTVSVNGHVNNALASGSGVLQVNGNVDYLDVSYGSDTPRFGVSGTVAKANVKINSDDKKIYYNIAKGKASDPDAYGILRLEEWEYSTEPGANNVKPGNKGNGALDAVPKTGSHMFEIAIMMIALSLVFGTSSLVVLRKRNK